MLPTVFLIVTLLNLSAGTVFISPIKLFRLMREDGPEHFMVWHIRFPRVVMATLTGMALGLVGNVFQAITKNPLVDPYIVGTSAGATFGALLAMYFLMNEIAHVSVSAMSFAFAVLASLLTIALARRKSVVPVVHLVLSGVLVSTLFSAGSMLLLNIARRTLVGGHVWLYGSFSGITREELTFPVVSLALFFSSALLMSRYLDAMSLGERDARSLGVNVEFVKWYFFTLGSFTTATFVSKTGIIGFVGLVVPHAARILVGPRHSNNLIATSLIGGVFLSTCDTIARTLLNPIEIPVGIITAFVGAPFMLFLLKANNFRRQGL